MRTGLLDKLEKFSNWQIVALMMSISLVLVLIGKLVMSDETTTAEVENRQRLVLVSNPLLEVIVGRLTDNQIEINVIGKFNETLGEVELEKKVDNFDLGFWFGVEKTEFVPKKFVNLSMLDGIQLGTGDGFYWMSTANALVIISGVGNSLKLSFPEMSGLIAENQVELERELITLDKGWRKKFARGLDDTPVNWKRLNLLARDYGLKVEADIDSQFYITPVWEKSENQNAIVYDPFGFVISTVSYKQLLTDINEKLFNMMIREVWKGEL